MFRKAIIILLTLVAVGTLLLWAASLWLDFCWIIGPHHEDGHISFSVTSVGKFNVDCVYPVDPLDIRRQTWEYGGFMLMFACSYDDSIQMVILTFPAWLPFVVFAVYPSTAFILGPLRRHRRRKKGLCLECGYNLTGNVSGVCPECGEPVSAQQSG